MSLPSKNQNERYTFKDFLNWPEDERWELIDGIPYMQAMPSRIHQKVSGELFRQISNYLQGKPYEVYSAPFCVRLPKNDEKDDETSTVVAPDLAIICDPSKLDEKGCLGAPDLIMEIISPASVKTDRVLKFNIYERAGVKEYWIVEPEGKVINVF